MFLVELRDVPIYFAMKCLKKDVVLEDDDVECTLVERQVLSLGSHNPFICKLFCTFQTDSHLFFVMEFLRGGDLMFHVQNEGSFTEDRARYAAGETCWVNVHSTQMQHFLELIRLTFVS